MITSNVSPTKVIVAPTMTPPPKSKSDSSDSVSTPSSTVINVANTSTTLKHLITQSKVDRKKFIADYSKIKSLRSITLETSHIKHVDFEESLENANVESVILNGTKLIFFPSKGSNDNFLDILQELSGRLGNVEGVSSSPLNIFEGIIRNLSRTILKADCIRELNFNNITLDEKNNKNSSVNYPDFLFLPIKPRNRLIFTSIPPTEIEMAVMGSCVHATLCITVPMGLFLTIHLKEMGQIGQRIVSLQHDSMGLLKYCDSLGEQFDKFKPWVTFRAVMNCRINFDNGQTVRLLSLHVQQNVKPKV